MIRTLPGLFVVLIAWLISPGSCRAQDVGQGVAQRPDWIAEILDLPGSGTDYAAIDFEGLPRLAGDHAVIHGVAWSPGYTPDQPLTMEKMRLNLHNYLAHHEGRFWCIWSDGPQIEDWPTQEVKFATSDDGLHWSPAKSVTGTPEEPYAFIARGLWVRDGQLLALAAHYRGKGAFGVNKELELWAYGWNPRTETWEFLSKVYDNAINNFPPQPLPDGNWIMTRRDARFNVSILIGGRQRLDQWDVVPVVRMGEVPGFRPDEPIIWLMPDRSVQALFRDNGGSMRLYQSVSRDSGRTWETPVLTNFPNATSKIVSLGTSRGYRVLVSNANVRLARRELHLSVSSDGRRFTRMARLDIPALAAPLGYETIWAKFAKGVASLQYPHVLEHDNCLYIALSRCKLQTEVFRIPLDSIDALLK
ncbi:MAG: sialidase family protein [Pirellulaceae bacterium]